MNLKTVNFDNYLQYGCRGEKNDTTIHSFLSDFQREFYDFFWDKYFNLLKYSYFGNFSIILLHDKGNYFDKGDSNKYYIVKCNVFKDENNNIDIVDKEFSYVIFTDKIQACVEYYKLLLEQVKIKKV